jgi:hypothetical protein
MRRYASCVRVFPDVKHADALWINKTSCSNVLPPPESERKLQGFVRPCSAPCWCDELRPRAVTFASRGKLELVLDSVGSGQEIRTV